MLSRFCERFFILAACLLYHLDASIHRCRCNIKYSFINLLRLKQSYLSPTPLQSFGLSAAASVAVGRWLRVCCISFKWAGRVHCLVSWGSERSLGQVKLVWKPSLGIAPVCCRVRGIGCGRRALPVRVQKAAELGYEPASLCFSLTQPSGFGCLLAFPGEMHEGLLAPGTKGCLTGKRSGVDAVLPGTRGTDRSWREDRP